MPLRILLLIDPSPSLSCVPAPGFHNRPGFTSFVLQYARVVNIDMLTDAHKLFCVYAKQPGPRRLRQPFNTAVQVGSTGVEVINTTIDKIQQIPSRVSERC